MTERRSTSLVARLASLSLSGCSSEPERQVTQYEMMVRAGADADDRCAKAQEVAEAFLTAEDESGYREWSLNASLECNRAALDRL